MALHGGHDLLNAEVAAVVGAVGLVHAGWERRATQLLPQPSVNILL